MKKSKNVKNVNIIIPPSNSNIHFILFLIFLIIIFIIIIFRDSIIPTPTPLSIIRNIIRNDFIPITNQRLLRIVECPSFPQRRFPIRLLTQKHPHEFQNDWYVLTFPRLQSILYSTSLPSFTRLSTHSPTSSSLPVRSHNMNYYQDLYHVWSQLPEVYQTEERKIVWFPHDRVERFGFPVIVKTRTILSDPSLSTSPSPSCKKDNVDVDPDLVATGGSILLKLNSIRHFGWMTHPLIVNDIPFSSKKSMVFWRGNATGYGFGNNIPYRSVSRETLVKTYAHSPFPFLDIGLSFPKNFLKDSESSENLKYYSKSNVSLEDQLQYKYILSVEGNDVATNLKWIMASNSLVMAPIPQIESWFLESRLIPYVHFLPLKDDFSDLVGKYDWAERHPQECEKMVMNAKTYVKPFLDQEKELEVQKQVMMYYLDTFQWIE